MRQTGVPFFAVVAPILGALGQRGDSRYNLNGGSSVIAENQSMTRTVALVIRSRMESVQNRVRRGTAKA